MRNGRRNSCCLHIHLPHAMTAYYILHSSVVDSETGRVIRKKKSNKKKKWKLRYVHSCHCLVYIQPNWSIYWPHAAIIMIVFDCMIRTVFSNCVFTFLFCLSLFYSCWYSGTYCFLRFVNEIIRNIRQKHIFSVMKPKSAFA